MVLVCSLRKILSVRENVPAYLTTNSHFTLTKEEKQDGCTLIDGNSGGTIATGSGADPNTNLGSGSCHFCRIRTFSLGLRYEPC